MRPAGRGVFSFTVVVFSILLIPLIFWMILRGFGFDKPRDLTPPAWVIGIEEYLEWRPGTQSLQTATDERGAVVLIAEGPWDSLDSSGPSAYVSAADGKMLDWVEDSQEGFWYGYSEPVVVKAAEALLLAQGRISVRDWRSRHFPE